MIALLSRSLCGVVLVIALHSGVTYAEQCSGNIRADEALSAERARYAAQTSNDFAAMERLFGEDLVYTHSSAAVDDKQAYIGSMKSGNVRYRNMTVKENKVRTYGCLAIITGLGEYDVTVNGQDLTVPLRFHAVWAKRADAVQFVSWQATRLPAK